MPQSKNPQPKVVQNNDNVSPIDKDQTVLEIKEHWYLTSKDPKINEYNMKGSLMFPEIVKSNPKLKQIVGEFIYYEVEEIVGEEKAPKVTGMLIDLPLEEIKGYLYDHFKLKQKIILAEEILTQILKKK